MIRDRQEAEALFQKSETYILEHEDVRTMSIEEIMNHFDDLDFDAGLNWGVIACIYVNSLEWILCIVLHEFATVPTLYVSNSFHQYKGAVISIEIKI